MSAPGRSPLAGWTLRAAFVASLAASGAICLSQLWLEPEAAHAAATVPVFLAGERIELTNKPARHAERLARTYLSGTFSLRTGDTELRTTRRALGARVDTEHLASLLAAAADSRSPLRRVHEKARGDRPLQLSMPADLDLTRASAFVTRLKDVTDLPALEARIDPRQRYVLPAHEGSALDLFATLDRIDAALRGGGPGVQAALRSVAPRKSAEALERLDLSAVLGDFETRYNRASVSDDRTHNLRVAASKLDGLVLQPGEVFDFNATVGNRTESNGFRPAPVIADGELIDGMGGGTCQIASTLHAAALFAGLPILTHFPHSRPSFYIKLGLDATVVYGAQNFRFQNDRPFPIVIGLSVDDGRVYASLHGRSRDLRVTITRSIDTIIPFEERTIYDRKLPDSVRVLEQRGIPGFKITRVRVTHDPARALDVSDHWNDTYPPTAQLWRVGIGGDAPEGFERPRNDPHPEYVADEFVQMTQSERGTEDVLRKPGQTGTPGWTERDGLVLRKP